MRIALIPEDSRPCCTQMVERIASHAGVLLVMPDRTEMDSFRTPSSYERIREFLIRELPLADAVVISLEHWCFGSLLESREETVSEAEAIGRVHDLEEILKGFTEVPVYMSTIILRSSISTFSQTEVELYEAVTEYSMNISRYEETGDMESLERARKAERNIPPEVLKRILAVRRRNLAVNLEAVRLSAGGCVQWLEILQEDSQMYGLPRKDQKKVTEALQKAGVTNFCMRNGADESGCMLTARAMAKGRTFEADVRFLGDPNECALYEDRPYLTNFKGMMRELTIMHTPGAESIIVVCCPINTPGNDLASRTLEAYAKDIDALLESGRHVYLLDVIRPNGGASLLVESMNHADRLYGYSAWNTASNSTGTLLAQFVSDQMAGKPNRRFFEERLLDDLIYESILREPLEITLRSLGENIYSLGDKAQAERLLREMMEQALPSLWISGDLPRYTISLPWNRTFEAWVEVQP